MSGISGFRIPDLPALPPIDEPTRVDHSAVGASASHELEIPSDRLPDLEGLSPEEVYDVFAELVKEFGSEEAKADLAAGKEFSLLVRIQGQAELELLVQMGPDGTASFSQFNGTSSKGGCNETQSPP